MITIRQSYFKLKIKKRHYQCQFFFKNVFDSPEYIEAYWTSSKNSVKEFKKNLLEWKKKFDEHFEKIDFDELGTTNDLDRGFHQGAKLADGGRLWQEAYTGQELKQKNADIRYRVWDAVRHGATEVKVTHRRPFKLPEWATWENTMDARIDIWGDKAPEWLYIQFGQHFKPPYVPAGSVFEDFAYQLNEEGSLLVEEIIAVEIETANTFSSKGIAVNPTANRSIQLLSGYAGLSNAGNPYRRGQFISRIPRV